VTVSPEHRQAAYQRRLDWGAAGGRALVEDAAPGDVVVVVDVLSFTTTLSLAVERGIEVFPHPGASADAAAYAAERDAVLARSRRSGPLDGVVSLSPASLDGVSGIERLVLPSPNGSAISFGLRSAGVTVVGACLRNAAAVGRWVRTASGRVSVVAAGERWADGSLRPAAEDLWAAGAVLDSLGPEGASPECGLAVAGYLAVRDHLGPMLAACASGRELVSAGFDHDVRIAAARDVSEAVPVLRGEAFVEGRDQSVTC
jgi:2-phosphosulfolactate phosphatase